MRKISLRGGGRKVILMAKGIAKHGKDIIVDGEKAMLEENMGAIAIPRNQLYKKTQPER